MSVREVQEPRGWAWRTAVAIVKPPLLATTRPDWRGGEHIPTSGGFVLVLNHISHVDPFTAAHLVHAHGRLPRYLAKADLFRHPLLRRFLHALGQIPVHRASSTAAGAYAAAVEAVRRGECVVVYPEGTITRDPGLWPMRGKSGAARIALATGCPVIPVGQWGAQDLLAPYSKHPHLLPPRKRISMLVGEPIDLSDLVTDPATPTTPEAVQRATDRILDRITGLVEELRGEQAPPERFDMRRSANDLAQDRDQHQASDRKDPA